MKTKLHFLGVLISFLCVFPFVSQGSVFKKPKLVLVLVVDQLRADLISTNLDLFLPPQKNGQFGGYRYLTDFGAYFPFAEYEVSHSMTCPGHAMILSGAYPYNTGIPTNEFRDPKTGKVVYCADDEKFGMSPERLQAPTFGDQLRLHNPQSRIFSVALKDRSSIMLGGKAANQVYWFNQQKFEWVTSGYYEKNALKNLDWIKNWNNKIQPLKDSNQVWTPMLLKENFRHETKAQDPLVLGYPFGIDLAVQFTEQMIRENGIGKSEATDLLALSISSHDISGHEFGPSAPEVKDLTLLEDRAFSKLFNLLNKQIPGGLKNVLIVLTADHGVGPTPGQALSLNLDAGVIDQKQLVPNLNKYLEKEFGKLPNNYILESRFFNLYYSEEFKNHKDRAKIEAFLKELLQKEPGILHVMSEQDYLSRHLPPEIFGRQAQKTYIPGKSGDMVYYPKPYFIDKNKPATHLTGYAYDRTVPVIFAGPGIKKGIYSDKAFVVDIVPTLSFILGLVPPAMSEGKVLSSGVAL